MEHSDRLIESACKLESVLDAFESACRIGESPSIREWLNRVPTEKKNTCLTELIRIEVSVRQQFGQISLVDDYLSQFPDRQQAVLAAFQGTLPTGDTSVSVDRMQEPLQDTNDWQATGLAETTGAWQRPNEQADNPPPEMAGRYRIERLLGKGAFGAV